MTLFPELTKKRLVISFSGGRTSAYMTWWLLNVWPDRNNWEMVVVFANTGLEAEGTLEFVRECATIWNIEIIWIEYTPGSRKGWKVIPKQVTFETASRNGEPFELMIQRLGIPSTNTPFCSTILKNRTIKAFFRAKKWRKYYVAIGIRNDEIDRISESYLADRILYPFIMFNPTYKIGVRNFWELQPFDLRIHEDEGNCKNCWKKDILRLVRNARRIPESFDWYRQMTNRYGHLNPRESKLLPPFNFYRGNLSPDDIFKLALLPDNEISALASREKLDGCAESCEAF